MGMTPDDVARLAQLARLELTDDECAELAPELDVILSSVEQVSRLGLADVPLTTHASGMANVFRSDEVRESLTSEQALAAAPAVDQQRFRVPQILSEQA